jgi:ATP-binding cassette subfamily C protein
LSNTFHPKSFSLQTLLHYIKAQKHDFWRANLYAVFSTLVLLPIPMLIPLLIDEVLLGHPGKMSTSVDQILSALGMAQGEAWQTILVILMLVLLLRALGFVFSNAMAFYAGKITQKIGYLLRHRVLHHLERVAIAEYETLKPGGVAARTTQDVDTLSGFTGMVVITFLSASLMLIGIAAIMLWMNWVLALLVFILNPLFLGFSRIIGKKTGEYLRRQNEAYELYHEALNETLDLFVQVRASNQERSFFSLLQNRARAIRDASLDYGYKSVVAYSSSTLLTTTVVDIFRALGIAAVAYSDLTIGMMLAFLFYLSNLVQPVNQLMGLVITYQSTKPAFKRVNKLLQLRQEPDYPQLQNPFKEVKTTSLELKNISFGYDKTDVGSDTPVVTQPRQVLYNVSLKIEAGIKVALVGSSGGGKTTLSQIMVGFYQPQQGEVLYGGVAVTEIGLPVVRANVALMLQQSLFFNDTIRMNLTLSAEMGDETIFNALRMAQLEDFVRSLEQGLDSLIGKNGIRLSGGQRQRLAIARLILSDPKVVIFDESTSALDNATESLLYDTLAEFFLGRTTIIIAHRHTTIKQADIIYLLEQGRIKAQGTYTKMKGFLSC